MMFAQPALLDVAPEPSAVGPVVIVILLAVVAAVVVLSVLRRVRRGR